MGLYYKNHRISGVNFLPRLTLSEYNNLTVKPEHWIRTDSPFDYSKTDVPKLTLAQYQDLAIKPKFWIRTDAPQSYTTISATQVDVTDSVSVKDYLDNLDATQVAYDSNTSVKEKIDDMVIATVTGTISANDGDTDIAYPTGFDSTNSIVLNFEIYGNGTWRSGIGLFNSIGTSRTFTMLKTDYVSLYNNNADYKGKDLRIHLAKLQS